MSLRIRFRFDGKCSVHPRYNPDRDGRPRDRDCPGCEALYVIHLYTRVAMKKAEQGESLIVDRPAVPVSQAASDAADGKPLSEQAVIEE